MPVHRNVLLLLAVVSTAAAQTRPARGSLTVLYTVGAEDGTVLDHVSAVLLRRDGHLLIADQGQRTILAFDATGRAQAPLGRTGAGPAEYRAPVGLASIGDTIAVLDPRNARIGLFSPTGHWYGQWRVQPITGDAMIRLYRVAGPEFYAIASVPGVRQPAFVRYDARGAQDTIVPAPSVEAATHRALCKGSDLGIRVFTTALHPRRLRLAGPRSSYLDAETGTYRIEQRDAGGSVRRTFIGTATPIPITDAAWDSAGLLGGGPPA